MVLGCGPRASSPHMLLHICQRTCPQDKIQGAACMQVSPAGLSSLLSSLSSQGCEGGTETQGAASVAPLTVARARSVRELAVGAVEVPQPIVDVLVDLRSYMQVPVLPHPMPLARGITIFLRRPWSWFWLNHCPGRRCLPTCPQRALLAVSSRELNICFSWWRYGDAFLVWCRMTWSRPHMSATEDWSRL